MDDSKGRRKDFGGGGLTSCVNPSTTTVVPRLACGLGHARGLTAVSRLSFKTLAPLRYL